LNKMIQKNPRKKTHLKEGNIQTAFPKSRSSLPKELLVHIARGGEPFYRRPYHVARGSSMVLRKHLNKMIQKNPLKTTHFKEENILTAIRNECALLRKSQKYSQLAKNIADWIGPVHWKRFLHMGGSAMNICPGCHTLVIKKGGCGHMVCVCGGSFNWIYNQLDATALRCAYFCETQPDALILRQRILRKADRMVRSAKQSRPKRPLLQMVREEIMMTSEDFDFNDEEEIEDTATGSGPFDSNYENETDNLSVDLSLPYTCDLSPNDHDTLWEIERELLSDDSSIAPSELSLADFIILSESLSSQDDDTAVVVSLPDSSETEHNDDESSFSFVSGDSDESDASFSLVPSVSEVHSIVSETTRLSYSMAVKKGMNRYNDAATEAVALTSPTYHTKKNRKKTKGNSHNDDNDIEEEPNLLESIYEGYKLCRGGRLSRQFKGNPQSLKSSSNHTRPNWSRKRRKSYRVVRHGQSLFDRRASRQKSSSG